MNPPYVGVSGIMSAPEARACIDAWREAWAGREPTHDLMLGVLASAKTLRGEPNKYPRRYPKREDIASCMVESPGVLPLLHYAGAFDVHGPVDPADELATAIRWAGPTCRGFQFNGPWPKQLLLRESGFVDGRRIVLQARTSSHPGLRVHVPWSWAGIATDILFDFSAGRGVLLDVEHATREVTTSRDYWKNGPGLGAPMGLGVAGGLCAETLPALAALFRDHRDLSTDMEGMVRDDADGGGNLDPAKARAALRAAVSLITTTSP